MFTYQQVIRQVPTQLIYIPAIHQTSFEMSSVSVVQSNEHLGAHLFDATYQLHNNNHRRMC